MRRSAALPLVPTARISSVVLSCVVVSGSDLACFHPIAGYQYADGGPIMFRPPKGNRPVVPAQVPCGKCVGCHIDRSKQWAIRCRHEAMMHEHNSFVTLTYRNEKLPDDYSVSVRVHQLFMKRLREAIAPVPIRFMMAAEYGTQYQRPHYHYIIFGYDFPDRKPWRRTGSGHLTYRSELLEKVWPDGHSEVGLFDQAAAGYVARYTLKKFSRDCSDRNYEIVHPVTGELVRLQPEFGRMSRNPGLGTSWYRRYHMDCFPSDFLVYDGKKYPVPLFYRNKLKIDNPELAEELAYERYVRGLANIEHNTSERLAVREEALKLRLAKLSRDKELST